MKRSKMRGKIEETHREDLKDDFLKQLEPNMQERKNEFQWAWLFGPLVASFLLFFYFNPMETKSYSEKDLDEYMSLVLDSQTEMDTLVTEVSFEISPYDD